eukprot:TRINITY_DN16547_c0_g1_i1.p1 TRINITY_DN16547_c0_g1~~TRINITY_DN16547_c0_g1_i1.p1  ORF type:complete len:125 (+),score=16.22 TRINITY_DN16547_c0_g1_i1:68-442(+)
MSDSDKKTLRGSREYVSGAQINEKEKGQAEIKDPRILTGDMILDDFRRILQEEETLKKNNGTSGRSNDRKYSSNTSDEFSSSDSDHINHSFNKPHHRGYGSTSNPFHSTQSNHEDLNCACCKIS